MKKQNKRKMKNKVISIITIAILLICVQYIFTIVCKSEGVIGRFNKSLFYNAVYASTNENNESTKSQENTNEGEYMRLTDLEFRSES